jgi:hypothetical protein
MTSLQNRYTITAHRLGGSSLPGFCRYWETETSLMFRAGYTEHIELEPVTGEPRDGIHLRFSSWEPGPFPRWFAGAAQLGYSASGMAIGTRPVLVYMEPSDVAVYTGFLDDAHGEVYSVGIRRGPV